MKTEWDWEESFYIYFCCRVWFNKVQVIVFLYLKHYFLFEQVASLLGPRLPFNTVINNILLGLIGRCNQSWIIWTALVRVDLIKAWRFKKWHWKVLNLRSCLVLLMNTNKTVFYIFTSWHLRTFTSSLYSLHSDGNCTKSLIPLCFPPRRNNVGWFLFPSPCSDLIDTSPLIITDDWLLLPFLQADGIYLSASSSAPSQLLVIFILHFQG